jgi:signal transduction histidine kinase/CheY-like chemotaxis protein
MNVQSKAVLPAFGIGVVAALLIGASLWAERNVAPGLMPHGVCFTWMPALLWLHVLSDALIGLAYLTIPITLVYFVRRRRDLPFHWIFLLFGLFIVSCGATHWLGIWTVWNPDYWVSGAVKVMTAAASLLTAVALVPLVPRALALPTTSQLQLANESLAREVQMRREAEAELRRTHAQLEDRVLERTQELSRAQAEAEVLRREAEQANQLKDQFLAKVSHELRTPLQSTMGWAEVLAHSPSGDEKARIAAERIAHNVRAQARLIDDLLDISRILSGKLGLDLQRASPAAVIERAISMLAPAAARVGVALRSDAVQLGEETIITDPVRLEQVLWNLISNAIQASSTGQVVDIGASRDDGRLRITVTDQGRGIEPEELRTIFEPFRQGRGSNSHRGLGLGLAIARSIVILLGGEVIASSDGAGRGARLLVELPLATSDAAAADEECRSPPDRTMLQSMRVLYVEDDPEVAASISAALRQHVGDVTACSSIDEALAAADEETFDVVITDLALAGGERGTDLLRRLRSRERMRNVPAIVVSAFGSHTEREATRRAGFVEHLVKPVATAALLGALLSAAAPKVA